MGVWPLPLMATKWLNSVSVVLYVYAPSTLACSLKWVRSGHGLVESDRVSPQKKKIGPWVGPFLFGPKYFSLGKFKTREFGLGQQILACFVMFIK